MLFTATQAADLSADPATGPVVFPHFADGGGYTTALTLTNTSEDGQSGVIIEFFSATAPPHRSASQAVKMVRVPLSHGRTVRLLSGDAGGRQC